MLRTPTVNHSIELGKPNVELSVEVNTIVKVIVDIRTQAIRIIEFGHREIASLKRELCTYQLHQSGHHALRLSKVWRLTDNRHIYQVPAAPQRQ